MTGIKPETFKKMLEILSDADRKKKARGERRNYDTIVIDATETPIERSKESKRSSILEKRRGMA